MEQLKASMIWLSLWEIQLKNLNKGFSSWQMNISIKLENNGLFF